MRYDRLEFFSVVFCKQEHFFYATYCLLHMRVSRSNGKVPERAAADTRHQKKSEKKPEEQEDKTKYPFLKSSTF